MSDRAFSGRDVQDALAQAAHALGVSSAGLRYVVLEPGTPGGPGLNPTPARIAVLLSGSVVARAPRPEPRARPEPAGSVAPVPAAEAALDDDPDDDPVLPAVEALAASLAAAAGAPILAELEDREDALLVFLRGEGTGILLSERGDEVFRALDHLLQTIFARNLAPRRLRLECEGLREHREEGLRRTALELAAAVLGDGNPRTTGPLNSYERRIVHVTIEARGGGLITYSVGDGKDRRVTVAPAVASLGGEVY